MSIIDDEWAMESGDTTIRSTSLSYIWVHSAVFVDKPVKKHLHVNVTAIIRNQSDYSNVVILIGMFSLKDSNSSSAQKMIFRLSEFLFKKCSEYIAEKAIKGKDGKAFEMPPFIYTEDRFTELEEL